MSSKIKLGYHTLFSGFLIHLILGTLYSWSCLSSYFRSFLLQKNSIKIGKVFLNNVFSFVIVIHNIFILVGKYNNSNYMHIYFKCFMRYMLYAYYFRNLEIFS